MIWVRIFSVGTFNRGRTRVLANTVPTLGRDRVGGTEEHELIGAAVRRRKGIAPDGMQAPVAGGDRNRPRGTDGPVALAVDAHPLVGDGPADAIGGEAPAC